MPDASNPPAHLVALPSLSSHLSALPQAKSMANVSLYTSGMANNHAAHSEAKLRKALSQTSSSAATPNYSAYAIPPSQSPAPGAQPLMMRKPVRTK